MVSFLVTKGMDFNKYLNKEVLYCLNTMKFNILELLADRYDDFTA